ncbi:MAG: hypothetical protein PHD95_05775 [Candidatus ainarchaeum sp.]|nr:hypothetical protein [Candidatus ainarchaeum sp.]
MLAFKSLGKNASLCNVGKTQSNLFLSQTLPMEKINNRFAFIIWISEATGPNPVGAQTNSGGIKHGCTKKKTKHSAIKIKP